MYKLYVSSLLDKKLLKNLPPDVLAHVLKYKNEDDQIRSLTGYTLLNNNIKGPYKISFDGKPRIEGIFFNISHDSDKACLVIGDDEIGVDIIKVRNLDNRLFEYMDIKDNLSDYQKCKIWAMKEAAIKYEGTSITKIKNIDCSKYLFDIIDEDDYIIAVCYGRG